MSSKIKKCEKIDQLIRAKRTGTPKELAKKIGVSETYAKRLIGFLRAKYDVPIVYTLERGYVYQKKGKFFVGWIDEE